MKALLKKIAYHVISLIGRHRWRYPDKRLLILMYHRVLPANHPDLRFVQPGMFVEPDTFRMQLKELKKLFTIVHLDDWLEKIKNGQAVPSKACAITFDDGWQDNYEYAFPMLQAENVPATIFLVSDLVGTSKNFWPERLGRILSLYTRSDLEQYPETDEMNWLDNFYRRFADDNSTCSRSQIDKIINCAKTESDEKIIERLDTLDDVLNVSANSSRDILDWEEVIEMRDSHLIRFGSHTRRHTRLRENVSRDKLQDEIIQSKDIIEKKLNIEVKTFCFPNGDFTLQAKEIVQSVYRGACTTISGWNTSRSDLHELKRIGVHQDITNNRTSFLARLSGWL